ncbi:hypothetical protein A3J23_00995 [Candidatus Peregrinibacteria bacterium RIFCSPLOWO2_02_FULL_48_14]|nr:MAG: hypothetical protein A2974_03685 [Candidatus Peregrinibacteria bacterium RIFCSPLOWO2_01_FULL_48_20]OGJ43546.1 MAG: hypothetical protein A3J23_00995 [Candidatus Peregrinibacteria bacterium RIFCSPLOWO2_02_FULL_48_14]
MPNRNLNTLELKKVNTLLGRVRKSILEYSNGDLDLEFALRRKIYKELTYDERGKPHLRMKLKKKKRVSQNNLCTSCKQILPLKYAVLDRLNAKDGYTEENTNLICPDCDTEIQRSRSYK